MDLLQTYLRELHFIRGTGAGVAETSYYGALGSLLNGVGAQIKPSVRCLLTLKNQGAGLPDGGFFTPDQMGKAADVSLLPSLLPARGVLEVKGTESDLAQIVASAQVQKYWDHYGQVLVTNLRDWALVGRDADGKKTVMQQYRLALSEEAFWKTDPATLVASHEEAFVEYLKRALLQAAPLQSPEDVAWFLASYARDAKSRMEHADLPALQSVRAALEQALGLQFSGPKGEHFFRSTLIQTLFYGVFSAWVLWCQEHESAKTSGRFDWRLAGWDLHVPMISALFAEVAKPANLGALGLVEVLDWTGAALNRVDRGAFFAKFDTGQAVQYFYEPFLQAFDPELRKDLGVWYTPPEIVRYMVARVDTVLKTELDIPDGLADSHVYVLDPCCGTGAYLVETLRHIQATLDANGGDALAANDLKKAATERVFGFEILPAPFVVAHLQLGLLLQQAGAPLADTERAGVFLTNALTGWEPGGKHPALPIPEFAEERDRADEIKQQTKVLVVLGNPPYNAFAGTSPDEEQGIVDLYKKGLNTEWGIKKFNLDDLYVRFFRLAERKIGQHKGIVCYISNFSYLTDPSFVVMRQRFLSEFDTLWFDSLNGDSRETGKLTPEGKPDPSIFSTQYNREGIRVGTAIGLMVRKEKREPAPTVHFRQFWGVKKREELLESVQEGDISHAYLPANPTQSNRFSFRPSAISAHYESWPSFIELCSQKPFNGPIERRGNSLIAFQSENNNFAALQSYLDDSSSDAVISNVEPRFMKSSGEFKADKARNLLKGKVQFDASKIVKYPFKPFDLRLAYLDAAIQPLFSRPSPDLLEQQFTGNKFLVVRETGVTDPTSPPFYFSPFVCDYHCMVVEAKHVPFYILPKTKKGNAGQGLFLEATATPKANLSEKSRQYLASLGFDNPDVDEETASLIWMHALAIGYSPAYLTENAEGLRQDWPRIPLPDTREALEASAVLGRQVAALLDTEQDVPGVTAGPLRPELRPLGPIQKVGGGQIQSESGDLRVSEGWGHGGQGGVTMPGKGRAIPRAWTDAERRALADGAAAQGLTPEQMAACLGETTYTVYLNSDTYWNHIPGRVWEYTIGGYQVLKKWLSYREHTLLGRDLTANEARYITQTVRRLAALRQLEPALDQNYSAVKGAAWSTPSREEVLLNEYHNLVDQGSLSKRQAAHLRSVEAQLDIIDEQDPQELAVDDRLKKVGEELDALLEELKAIPEKVSPG